MKKLIPLFGSLLAILPLQAALYVGGTAGYLVDDEEEYYTGRVGYIFSESSKLSHGIELEAGYADYEENGIGAEAELMPAFLNYRVSTITREKGCLYGGFGAGMATVDAEVLGVSDDDTAIVAQLFGGLQYSVWKDLSVTAGARYIWVDSTELYGLDVEKSDDIVLEIGASFKF